MQGMYRFFFTCFAISATYIVGSDLILKHFIEADLSSSIQTLKGILFVVAASLLLAYWVEKKLTIVEQERWFNKSVFFISVFYSIGWIVITDYFVIKFKLETSSIQTLKGLFYVFTWSLVMTWFYKREEKIKKSLFPIFKQSQLGNFCGMIVHEVRTPLQIALHYNEVMLIEKRYDEEKLHGIKNSLNSIKEIVSFFAGLAGKGLEKGNVKKEKFKLKELATNTFQKVMILFPRTTVTLENQIDESLQINASKSLIEHLFINLYKNAIEYMIEEDLQEKFVCIEVHSQGDKITLSISNAGTPIPKKISKRIFDVFTTKADSGGLGLGLSISKEIVEFHGGSIEYADEAGRPTFRVTI